MTWIACCLNWVSSREVSVAASDRCMSLREASERLGVSIKTVRRLIRDQELPAVRIRNCILIRESDLNAYISSL